MSQDEVRTRIESFVIDFHRRWQRSGQPPSSFGIARAAFEAWTGELSELAESHCTNATATGEHGSLNSKPAHDPAAETISDLWVDGDKARACTILEDGPMPTYYEYRLVRVGREWRIDQLLSFLDPPGRPLVTKAEGHGLLELASLDAALSATRPELQLDLPSLFAHGREVVVYGEKVPLEVVSLGEITSASGVLTVRDFGYGGLDLQPLARRIAPGTYTAEVSRAAQTNVALRVVLADRPTASWHPADLAQRANVVGVDAGNVAVLDLASLVTCDAQRVEELFQDQAAALQGTGGVVFSLTGDANDAVIVTSGYGDGAYPCYWGVDADGTPTSLVVDFLVLVEDHARIVTVPWQVGPSSDPELMELGLEIDARGRSFLLSHHSDRVSALRVVGPDGTLLMDGNRLGLSVEGGRQSQSWTPKTPPPPGSVLEVRFSDGYRHI